MRARRFKQATTTAHPAMVTNSYVTEALAKQAASRPAKTPAKALSTTPPLPRVRKRKRGRSSGK
jgi:hypothetical protein